MARHRVAIVWLKRALRLADHPALAAALELAETVAPVAVWPAAGSPNAPGAASRAWLARSLEALDTSLCARGSQLVVRTGDPAEALTALAAGCGATLVCHDLSFDPDAVAADAATVAALEDAGVQVRGFDCTLLNDPDGPRSSGGGPFRVFTPYYRACLRLARTTSPEPAPSHLPVPGAMPAGLDPASLPGAEAHPLGSWWTPGEAGALAAAARFFGESLDDYPADRDRPDLVGTSRLSPHLAFGEIAPQRLVTMAEEEAQQDGTAAEGAAAFVRQLYWREFAYHTLHHFPHTTSRPLLPAFEHFGWAEDPAGFDAWTAGRTGYPIVDAGMRELAATGWMHNRVRMIVASFLTKDLLLPWQLGARHFLEHLADADAANNAFGWQWVAGSGADAAPYFRVFNPTLQGAKFDPAGGYVRAWVPEIAELPDRWLHRPWEAPREVLAGAGVTLGESYPLPVVDHADARVRALAAYGAIRGGRG